ncbi:MAG: SAM-dependent methyltransferase, partial [Bacillota bacterium]|nr:SAM-dependent methyltransferase [Bacillota bacterium]
RRLGEIMAAASAHRLEPKRLRLVQPNLLKGANLVLLEFVKGGNPGLTVEETLLVYGDDGTYHPIMKEIFEEPK